MSTIENLWDCYKDSPTSLDKIKVLPLSHNTDYALLEQMMEGKGIKPLGTDKIFKKPVLFFYYGLPVFFKKSMEFPCIMVFKSKHNLDLYKELDWSPTDTGVLEFIFKKKSVFKTGFENFDADDFKKKFVLSDESKRQKSISYLDSHIRCFFGDNINYLKGKVKEEIGLNYSYIKKVHKLYFQAANRYQELSAKLEKMGCLNFDRRIKVIEGHTDMPVRFLNVEPIFCYIPNSDDFRDKIIDYFGVTKDIIHVYDDEIDFTVKRTISEGIEKYIDLLEKGEIVI